MKSNLKTIRIKSGNNQKYYAEIFGISKSYMCMLENEQRTPSLELAYYIAEILLMNVEDIWPR